MKDLKERAIRGGVARMCAQAADFLLRVVSLMILARLLGPKDFGLVGMVTAFTGVLGMFRDFGLSSAAVQLAVVTDEQISTLFWINILAGAVLGSLTLAMAPAIVAFYHEPRLFGVTAVLAVGFLLNSAGVQHGVLLQRQMRFTTLAVVSIVSLVVGTAVAIGGAMAGYGYWALVAMTVTSPLIITIGVWLSTGWVPGRPHRRTGILSMMRFGGTVTLYGLVGYVATNLEKVLIARFWGAGAIGIYGRAYQLVNIPTQNLNSAVGDVAFSAFSRIQDDPNRLKSYFLKGYSLLVALTLPITIACALFADDVIYVLLGPKWKAAAVILRLLAPTILVFAITNPLVWLLTSIGRVGRLLKMMLVIAPLMITGYAIGLPYGPRGVACGYSGVMVLWVVPCVVWAVHGTGISFWDIVRIASRPLASGTVAAVLTVGVLLLCGHVTSPLSRLLLESAVLLIAYSAILLFVAGQRPFYVDLFRTLTGRPRTEEKSLASV